MSNFTDFEQLWKIENNPFTQKVKNYSFKIVPNFRLLVENFSTSYRKIWKLGSDEFRGGRESKLCSLKQYTIKKEYKHIVVVMKKPPMCQKPNCAGE